MDTITNDGVSVSELTRRPEDRNGRQRLPEWLKITANFTPEYFRIKEILSRNRLHSVCQEASCPNIRECFGEGTATFLIMGPNCTRGCRFCDITSARPLGLDLEEPARLAAVVAELKLKQVVITSVTRDDLPDGGASIFARTIELLRRQDKDVRIEVLIPDLKGDRDSVATVLLAAPEVFAHNVETVSRLYKRVRPGAILERSLSVLKMADQFHPRPVVKTGFMLGLGETLSEIEELFHQIYDTGTQIVTVGQYLRPSPKHLPIEKYYRPDEFKEIAAIGRRIGFAHVEAGPLVRSSYRAFNQSKGILGERQFE
ncbi:Lipoyl synthase [Candidatus Zixiibacteriota bacterium]|nr:Lipoyl synthase [candidate division Zixibacteria bacterium]